MAVPVFCVTGGIYEKAGGIAPAGSFSLLLKQAFLQAQAPDQETAALPAQRRISRRSCEALTR